MHGVTVTFIVGAVVVLGDRHVDYWCPFQSVCSVVKLLQTRFGGYGSFGYEWRRLLDIFLKAYFSVTFFCDIRHHMAVVGVGWFYSHLVIYGVGWPWRVPYFVILAVWFVQATGFNIVFPVRRFPVRRFLVVEDTVLLVIMSGGDYWTSFGKLISQWQFFVIFGFM